MNGQIGKKKILKVPGWLVDLSNDTPVVDEKEEVVIANEKESVEKLLDLGLRGKLPDGSRPDSMFKIARGLIRQGTDPTRVKQILNFILEQHKDSKQTKKNISNMVSSALKYQQKEETKKAETFAPKKVSVFMSSPPRYQLRFKDEKVLYLDSKCLLNRGYFRQKYFELFNFIPEMPDGDDWVDLVNCWMAEAEKISMPEETSFHQAIEGEIQEVLDSMTTTDNANQSDRCIFKKDNGDLFISMHAIQRILKTRFMRDVPMNILGEVCKGMRMKDVRIKSKGKFYRLWHITRPIADKPYDFEIGEETFGEETDDY